MPIPQDTFFTVTPSTNFKSKAEASLNGVDYFFFVADNGDLRVQTFKSTSARTLAVGCSWVGVIQASDRIHVYFTNTSGTISYILFRSAQEGNYTINATGITGAVLGFSVAFAPNCVPPAYLLIFDNGNHNLYVASDPGFTTILGQTRTFSNQLSTQFYVTRPTIAVHPDDTNIATINVQQVKLQDGSSKVGFYVVTLPGVV